MAARTMEIPLTQGKTALIDAEDYPKIAGHSWMYHYGYARAGQYDPSAKKTRTLHMSHLILPCPPGLEVDHINRNKLDNRKENLRLVTRSQNCANRGNFKNSKSQYKGVRWNKKMNLWEASIRKDNVVTNLGAFDDEIAAASAYNEYARKMWGDFAVLNDIDEVDFRRLRHFKSPNASSRFLGVTRRKNGKWVARLTVNGKRQSLGYFDKEEDAARAFNEAYLKYKGKESPNVI